MKKLILICVLILTIFVISCSTDNKVEDTIKTEKTFTLSNIKNVSYLEDIDKILNPTIKEFYTARKNIDGGKPEFELSINLWDNDNDYYANRDISLIETRKGESVTTINECEIYFHKYNFYTAICETSEEIAIFQLTYYVENPNYEQHFRDILNSVFS